MPSVSGLRWETRNLGERTVSSGCAFLGLNLKEVLKILVLPGGENKWVCKLEYTVANLKLKTNKWISQARPSNRRDCLCSLPSYHLWAFVWMFQSHCNSVATIREKVACLHLGQSSPIQETCMVVTVTIRMRNSKGKIRLKGQSTPLRFPDYLLVVYLGSEFAFFKDNKRLT